MLIQKLIYINNATLVLQYQIVENLVMSFSYETLQKKNSDNNQDCWSSKPPSTAYDKQPMPDVHQWNQLHTTRWKKRLTYPSKMAKKYFHFIKAI